MKIAKADREMAATICAILASQVIWADYVRNVADELQASATARYLADATCSHTRFSVDHHANYGECEALIRTGWTPW